MPDSRGKWVRHLFNRDRKGARYLFLIARTSGAAGGNVIRVTQFYTPKLGRFGPGSTTALTAAPERNWLGLFVNGPYFGSPTARAWVTPFSASQMTWWSRLCTGRGSFRNYVEFYALTGELQRVGGLYKLVGLGKYQRFMSGPVSLVGRAPTFGVLGPNYGQYLFVTGVVAGGAGAGFVIYWSLSE